MEICIRYGGQVHCLFVPELQVPVLWHGPNPGPVDYPAFLADAMIWRTVQGLVGKVSDENVRGAMRSGMAEALRAMQQHAGKDVEIRVSEGAGQ